MDLTTQLTEIVNFFSPYVTKEYILNIFELAKTILIILFFLFIIKSFLKLKLFKRVKLLLKNLIEINNKWTISSI